MLAPFLLLVFVHTSDRPPHSVEALPTPNPREAFRRASRGLPGGIPKGRRRACDSSCKSFWFGPRKGRIQGGATLGGLQREPGGGPRGKQMATSTQMGASGVASQLRSPLVA